MKDFYGGEGPWQDVVKPQYERYSITAGQSHKEQRKQIRLNTLLSRLNPEKNK